MDGMNRASMFVLILGRLNMHSPSICRVMLGSQARETRCHILKFLCVHCFCSNPTSGNQTNTVKPLLTLSPKSNIRQYRILEMTKIPTLSHV